MTEAVFVTGFASGLGSEIAALPADRGAELIGLDRMPPEGNSTHLPALETLRDRRAGLLSGLEQRALGTGIPLVEQHVQPTLEIADRGSTMSHRSIVLERDAEELRQDQRLIVASDNRAEPAVLTGGPRLGPTDYCSVPNSGLGTIISSPAMHKL